MMQFSTYLFDFDGTLCDTRESLLPVFQAGYAAVNRPVTPEEVEKWMHLNLTQSMEDSGIAREDFPKVTEAIIAALDMPESIKLIRLFEDTIPVLQALKRRGARLGIVSNNTSMHIRLVLQTLNVPIEFACVVGSDMFTFGKPHREPIDVALREMGLPSADGVCYVGDSLQDPECGIAAGIGGILLDRENRYESFHGSRILTLNDLL